MSDKEVVLRFGLERPEQLASFFALFGPTQGLEFDIYAGLGNDVALPNVANALLDGYPLPDASYRHVLKGSPAGVLWTRQDAGTLVGKHLECWPYKGAYVDVQPVPNNVGWDVVMTLEMDPDSTLLRTVNLHRHLVRAMVTMVGTDYTAKGAWGAIYVPPGY